MASRGCKLVRNTKPLTRIMSGNQAARHNGGLRVSVTVGLNFAGGGLKELSHPVLRVHVLEVGTAQHPAHCKQPLVYNLDPCGMLSRFAPSRNPGLPRIRYPHELGCDNAQRTGVAPVRLLGVGLVVSSLSHVLVRPQGLSPLRVSVSYTIWLYRTYPALALVPFLLRGTSIPSPPTRRIPVPTVGRLCSVLGGGRLS